MICSNDCIVNITITNSEEECKTLKIPFREYLSACDDSLQIGKYRCLDCSLCSSDQSNFMIQDDSCNTFQVPSWDPSNNFLNLFKTLKIHLDV